MADPGRLTVSVKHADGSVTRWAADEPNAENVPGGLSFSSSIPGGYADAQFSLPRKLTREYLDESLFDEVTISGPGGQVAWEGRVARLPREHGDQPSLSVGCVGHSARLRDDATFKEIYVDQDKSKWQPAALQRKSNLVAAGVNVSDDVSVGNDTGTPALQLAFPGPWTRSTRCEAWYDANGLALGSVYYAVKVGTNVLTTDANFDRYVSLSTDDVLSSDDAASAAPIGAATTGTLSATTDTRKWVRLRFQYTGAAGTEGYVYTLLFTGLAVYGNHGLTKRGTATTTIGQGFYASDIIADVLSRQCPDLAQDIAATAYPIPQASYLEPTTAEDIILDLNKYHQMRWACWGKTFRSWFANPQSATTWEARLGDGARLSLEGTDSLSLYNAVVVRYTDVDGKQRSAGPTWATNVDYTDSALELTDDVATAHGLRRCAVLNISAPLSNSTSDGDMPAVQIGRMWLAEQALPQRRGSLTVTGLIRHPTEGMVPVWRVRAGDFVRVSDRPNDPAREITQVSYDHESRTATLSVGGLPNKVESLLEMLASGVSAAGF